MQHATSGSSPRTSLPTHLSPGRIAVLSAAFILLLTLIPVGAYENALSERDYMHGDATTFLFIGLCLISFVLGAALVGRFFGQRESVISPYVYRASSLFPVAIAVFSVLVAFAALVDFVGTGGSFIAAITSGQGEALRTAARENAGDGVTPLTILPAGAPLLVWAIFRSFDLKSGRRIIYLSAVLYGVILVLVLQRNLLIPFVLSVAMVLSAVKFHAHGISLWRAFKFVATMAVFVIGAFALVAFFRGTGNESIGTSFMGYVPASVNRLSATLHGVYKSAYSGQPAFTFRFLWYPTLVRRFVPMHGIEALFGVTVPNDPTVLWGGEFAQVASGGLNPNFIWPTAFGYVFYDFSWYSCFYFFAFGMIAAIAWKRFIRRTPFGVIFYSYIFSAIALWGTDDFMSYPEIWIYIFVILFIWIFDARVISRRIPQASARGGVRSSGSSRSSGRWRPDEFVPRETSGRLCGDNEGGGRA